MLHSISWKQFIEFISWAVVELSDADEGRVLALKMKPKTLLKDREVRP